MFGRKPKTPTSLDLSNWTQTEVKLVDDDEMTDGIRQVSDAVVDLSDVARRAAENLTATVMSSSSYRPMTTVQLATHHDYVSVWPSSQYQSVSPYELHRPFSATHVAAWLRSLDPAFVGQVRVLYGNDAGRGREDDMLVIVRTSAQVELFEFEMNFSAVASDYRAAFEAEWRRRREAEAAPPPTGRRAMQLADGKEPDGGRDQND